MSGATLGNQRAPSIRSSTKDYLDELADAYAACRNRTGRTRGSRRSMPTYAGLPPTLIQVGSAETLLDDATRFAAAAGRRRRRGDDSGNLAAHDPCLAVVERALGTGLVARLLQAGRVHAASLVVSAHKSAESDCVSGFHSDAETRRVWSIVDLVAVAARAQGSDAECEGIKTEMFARALAILQSLILISVVNRARSCSRGCWDRAWLVRSMGA